MSGIIRIRAGIAEQMLQHVRTQPDLERCGLLAGSGAVIDAIFPAANALASATAYEISPQDLFLLFREMRSNGVELMGIYHSHVASENFPSPRDIEQAFYPESAYFILSPRLGALRPIRAFSILDGVVRELTVELVATNS